MSMDFSNYYNCLVGEKSGNRLQAAISGFGFLFSDFNFHGLHSKSLSLGAGGLPVFDPGQPAEALNVGTVDNIVVSGFITF